VGGNRHSDMAVKVVDPGVEIQEFLGLLDLPDAELSTLLLPWWDGGIAQPGCCSGLP
jgi:hypothetical protein